MIPFFFGEWERRLFGAYDPPSDEDRGQGVVICYPVGPEYYRAYAACRLLARRLAESGVHVLRFDYLGTGDSAGDPSSASPGDWIDNVSEAVEELKEMADLRGVDLVGLRLGAALAAAAAVKRNDVGRLVLWDPVSSGQECLDVFGALGASMSAGRLELAGEVYDAPFVQALRGFAPDDSYRDVPECLVVSTLAEERPYEALVTKIRDAGRACTIALRSGPCVWDESQDLVNTGMPVQALNEVVQWIARRA